MSGRPELSVVICSRDGAATLPRALAALARQSLDPSRFEVVVVDDGSIDATAAVAARAGARVVALRPSRGLAAARNAGVAASSGPVVAFTDDDCEPEPGWLAALLAALADPTVDGVGGRVEPACESSFLLGYLRAANPLTPLGGELLGSRGRLYRLGIYARAIAGHAPALRDGGELYSVVGADMALRRELLEATGGFDPELRFGAEEEELCVRARSRGEGCRLRYAEQAVVRHHFRPSLADGPRRARAYGRGYAEMARRNPELRVIVYPVPVLGALALLAAFGRRRRPGPWWALLAAAAYPRYLSLSVRRRSLEPLPYGFLQLAEELATMVGEAQGRWLSLRTENIEFTRVTALA